MHCPLRLYIQCLQDGQAWQVRQFNAGMVQGQNQVGQEAVRFGISFIQRQPGHYRLGCLLLQYRVPLHQQSGFAVAGRSGQQRQRNLCVGLHGCQQGFARD